MQTQFGPFVKSLVMLIMMVSFARASPTASTIADPPLFFSIAATDAENDPSPGEKLDKLRRYYSQPPVAYGYQEIQSVLANNEQRRRENDLLSSADGVLKFEAARIGDLVTAQAQSPLGRAVTQFGSQTIDALLKDYFDRAESKRDALALEAFREDLSAIPHEGTGMTVSDVQNYYKQHGDHLLGSGVLNNLGDLSSEDRHALFEESVRRLISHVASLGAMSDGPTPEHQQIDVAQLPSHQPVSSADRDSVSDFIRTSRALSKDMGQLATTQDRIYTTLSSIATEQQSSSQKAGRIYEVLVSQLPPSRQLSLIEKDESLAQNEREKLVSLLKERQLIEETVPHVIKDLNDVGKGAAQLGAPPDVVNVFETTVRIASGADVIAKELRGASADPITIATTLISMFAGVSASSAEDRHFASLMGEIARVERTQRRTLELLDVIDSKLSDLVRITEIMNEKLDEIKEIGRTDLESHGLVKCELLDQARPAGGFPGWAARAAHFERFANNGYFPACLDALDELFGKQGEPLNPLFDEEMERDVRYLEAGRYETVKSLVFSLPTFADKSAREKTDIFIRLLALSVEPTPLDEIPALAKQTLDGRGNADRIVAASAMKLLSVTAIAKYTRYLLNYHFYPVLIKRQGSRNTIRSPLEVQAEADSTEVQEELTSARERLKFALRIVNTAIAQQEVMSASLPMLAIDNQFSAAQFPRSVYVVDLTTPGASDASWKTHINAQRNMRDNLRSTLALLSYDRVTQVNWLTFAMLLEVHPEILDAAKPYEVSTWSGRRYAEHFNLSAMSPTYSYQILRSHYCQDVIKYYPPLNSGRWPMFMGCMLEDERGLFVLSPTVTRVIQPQEGFESSLIPWTLGKLDAPVEGFQDVPTPNVKSLLDLANGTHFAAVYGAQMMLLENLKAALLKALDEYTALEGLDSKHKQIATIILTKSLEASGAFATE